MATYDDKVNAEAQMGSLSFVKGETRCAITGKKSEILGILKQIVTCSLDQDSTCGM